MISIIIITSLFCLGFTIAREPGMILDKLGLNKPLYRLKKKAETEVWLWNIIDPLFDCIYCMSSLWSVLFYSILSVYTIQTIYELPIIIFCVCGLNGVLDNLARK